MNSESASTFTSNRDFEDEEEHEKAQREKSAKKRKYIHKYQSV